MYDLWTYKEAIAFFGVSYETIKDLVKAHGITPKPIPLNGRAKGLDFADMCILAKALGKPQPPRRKPQPAVAV